MIKKSSEEENLNNIKFYFIGDKNDKDFLSNKGNNIYPKFNEYVSLNHSLNNESNPFINANNQSKTI